MFWVMGKTCSSTKHIQMFPLELSSVLPIDLDSGIGDELRNKVNRLCNCRVDLAGDVRYFVL